MKLILILLSTVAVAYGGVGVVTPEIESEALRLWAKYCDGASEGGQDSGAFIYCKRSQDKIEETLEHEAQLTSGPSASDQIVFVQPPSYHYKHEVQVTGGGASAPKTVIYVKAAKNTHEVNVQDNTSPGAAPQKPTLYFLKGNHGGADGEGDQSASRSRRHHVPGHEGHEDSLTDLNNPASTQQVSGNEERAPLKPVSPTPVIYILKMRHNFPKLV